MISIKIFVVFLFLMLTEKIFGYKKNKKSYCEIKYKIFSFF